jgi:hypothetical protein
MYQAIERMQDYDFTLHTLGVITGDLKEEKLKEGLVVREEHESDVDISVDDPSGQISGEHDRSHKEDREQVIYSDDPEYNNIVEKLEDIELIPEPPEKAK